jgi:hypothetical protein
MSKKGEQLDVLGEAHLPADLFTPTDGSSYGIGTYPDMDYGLGVLEGYKVPGTSPEAGVPDGVVRSAEEEAEHSAAEVDALFADDWSESGLDFTDIMKEGSDLTDLS